VRKLESPPMFKKFACQDGNHYFREGQIPPGTLCICGQKVIQYEPCPTCRQPHAVTSKVRELQEGDLYV
jgi:hypothetical protein